MESIPNIPESMVIPKKNRSLQTCRTILFCTLRLSPKAMIEDSSRITPATLSATDVLMQSFELSLFDDGPLCGQLLGR